MATRVSWPTRSGHRTSKMETHGRFQVGIVLYDSERIPDPPLPDPSRVLRNIASPPSCETRSRNVRRSHRRVVLSARSAHATRNRKHRRSRTTRPTRATVPPFQHLGRPQRREDCFGMTLDRSLTTQTWEAKAPLSLALAASSTSARFPNKRSNILGSRQAQVQQGAPSLGKGAAIALIAGGPAVRQRVRETTSLKKADEQIADSANHSRSVRRALQKQGRPFPSLLRSSRPVFSSAPAPTRFQQRLDSLSSNSISGADGRGSDTSDPFRDFESFGQSSHAPTSASMAVNEDDESTQDRVESADLYFGSRARPTSGAAQAAIAT